MYSSSDEFINLDPFVRPSSPLNSPWLTHGTNYIGPVCAGSTDVNQCVSLTRISVILGYYNEWMNKQQEEKKEEKEEKNNSMYEFINNVFDKENGYSSIQLINDYHHLIENHSHQFEDIYNRIIKQYHTDIIDINHIKTSYFIARNYRKKSNFNPQENNKLYFDNNNNNNSKEICVQQILDTILCYFMYSIGLGYVLSKNVSNSNNDSDIKQTMPATKSLVFKSFGRASLDKKPMYKKEKEIEEMVNIFKRIDLNRTEMKHNLPNEMYNEIYKTENNKFQSITRHIKNNNINDEEEKYEEQNNNNTDEMSQIRNNEFGYRYYYTNKWKDNDGSDAYNTGYKYKDWYIVAQYHTLKAEILCHIWLEQWNQILEKANNYLNSDICKKIKAENGWKEYKRGSIVTMNHLIAILLYTNVQHIEYKLNATYHKISSQTESDKALKERHSHFANLARYLSESVQCFGKKIGRSKKMEYYHIINKWITMPLAICYNTPLSVTTSIIVAMNALYSYQNKYKKDQNGLLLQIGARNTKHFNCKWFSDYINESQIIFCHCKREITVENVIDIDLRINYHLYLYVFGVINTMLNGTDLTKKTHGMHFEVDNKMQNKLYPIYSFLYLKFYGKNKKNNNLKNESSNNQTLPIYVEQILNSYFLKVNQIEINWNQISKSIRKVNGFGAKSNNFNIKILSLIQSFICYYKMEWIKWHLFVNAFKNLQCITISGINLTKDIFEDMLFHIKNLSSQSNSYKLQKIRLTNVKLNKLRGADALTRYNPRFAKLKWQCVKQTYNVFEIHPMHTQN